MTEQNFKELLSKPESSILDFKTDLYDFTNDTDGNITSKFIKDILSFTNTIRETSAYIIYGVKENQDSTKELIGITKNIDDAILQDKVKSKVHPLPKFQYSTLRFDDKLFGIIEIPLVKYDFPIVSIVKMKGIEIGKTYFRQGSSNTEALTLDIIKICSWFQSLPQFETVHSFHNDISNFLKRLLTKKDKLSEVLPELYVFAKSNNYQDLKYFCELEIKGFDVSGSELRNHIQTEREKFKYRVQVIKISLQEISQSINLTPEQLSQLLNDSEDFYNAPYFFKEPLIEIERFLDKEDGFAKITMKVKDVLPNYQKDHSAFGYVFNSNFLTLYANIRQKLIDLIMDIN